MQLTIEGTNTETGRIVSIIEPGDDKSMDEMADMIRAALLAWGFQPDSVDELIEPR